DRTVGGYVVEHAAPALAGGVVVGIVEMTAKAVAAIDSAGAGGNDQCAAVVFVQQAGAGGAGVVADGVQCEARRLCVFGIQRQDLAQQWVVDVAAAHAGHERAWYAQWKQSGCLTSSGQKGTRQCQQIKQCVGIGYGVAQFMLPAGGA